MPDAEATAPEEYRVTIDAGPSNDASTDVGYTVRIWLGSRLLLSSTSQSYSSAEYAAEMVRNLIAGDRPVELIVRIKGEEFGERLR